MSYGARLAITFAEVLLGLGVCWAVWTGYSTVARKPRLAMLVMLLQTAALIEAGTRASLSDSEKTDAGGDARSGAAWARSTADANESRRP
jgi:hypothetical protein